MRADRTVAVALLLLIALAPVSAQPAVPRFAAVPNLALDAKKAGITALANVLTGPQGQVIVTPRGAGREIVAYDSLLTTVLWKLPIGRDQEIGSPGRAGWSGTTLWISDSRFDHIPLIDAKGGVYKSIGLPAVLRPTWANRRAYPVFGDFTPLAMYADGSMLAFPSNDDRPVATPDYDSTMRHIVRVSRTGIIQRTVAKVPHDPWVTVTSGSEHKISYAVPLAMRPMYAVSSDGFRVAVVAAPTKSDSTTFGVAVLNERSDTVFARRYPFRRDALTQGSLDSALGRINNLGSKAARDVRAEVRVLMPAYYPPVMGVGIGRDRTIWLTLRGPTQADSARLRLILDPEGNPIGSVMIKNSFVMGDMDRSFVWGVERKGNTAIAIARYKLVPDR